MSSAPQPEPCRIEIVAQAALGDLEAEWRQLWRAMPGASPFLAPAWLGAWTEVYAPGRTWAAALRDGGRLVGLLPVFVWNRALLLAGTGPSDHGGALILPGYEGWAGALLEAAAEAVDAPFDRIDLQQLAPESALAEATLSGWRAEACNGDGCSVLRLGGDDGMAAVPKTMRADWRYAARRLAREGGVVDLVPPQDASEGIAELERLHALRWRRRDEPGMLADPLLGRLLRASAPRLAAEGLLRLHRIRFDDEAVAVLLVLQGGRSACYFLSGFDPAHARLSPGRVLIGRAIAAAAEEGAGTFDFLRGHETYKTRWGAGEHRRIRRVFEPKKLPSC
jgi:CelD/BcsL family acetyltransferase involved in cellulose biosynthesis